VRKSVRIAAKGTETQNRITKLRNEGKKEIKRERERKGIRKKK
jgi:hypothetical protein